MAEPLRVGMIGYRFMGRAHANALARLPMFFPDAPPTERRVLVGRDEAALADAADRLGFSRTSTDWRDVIPEVDVLYVLTPNHLHAEPAITALEADVHVLCEKPLAHTLDAAERMRTAADGADATAGIAFNYRFLPAIRAARRRIEADELGAIRHVRVEYLQDWLADPDAPWSWRNDAELAGSGALGDLGSHMVDLVRYLVGDRAGDITAVSGDLRTFVDERPAPDGSGTRAVTADDAFSAQLRFASDAMGTLSASRVATGEQNALRIAIDGTRGALRFDLERLNELAVRREDGRGFERILVTDEDDPYVAPWWPPGHTLGWEHAIVHENAAFLSAVAAGEPHDPSFAAGHRVQVVLDAIERADATDAWTETTSGGSPS